MELLSGFNFQDLLLLLACIYVIQVGARYFSCYDWRLFKLYRTVAGLSRYIRFIAEFCPLPSEYKVSGLLKDKRSKHWDGMGNVFNLAKDRSVIHNVKYLAFISSMF